VTPRTPAKIVRSTDAQSGNEEVASQDQRPPPGGTALTSWQSDSYCPQVLIGAGCLPAAPSLVRSRGSCERGVAEPPGPRLRPDEEWDQDRNDLHLSTLLGSEWPGATKSIDAHPRRSGTIRAPATPGRVSLISRTDRRFCAPVDSWRQRRSVRLRGRARIAGNGPSVLSRRSLRDAGPDDLALTLATHRTPTMRSARASASAKTPKAGRCLMSRSYESRVLAPLVGTS
jgi:hypothetical protein